MSRFEVAILRVRLLRSAVEATTARAPDALVNELAICLGLVAEAHQRGEIGPDLFGRADRALKAWERFRGEGRVTGAE